MSEGSGGSHHFERRYGFGGMAVPGAGSLIVLKFLKHCFLGLAAGPSLEPKVFFFFKRRRGAAPEAESSREQRNVSTLHSEGPDFGWLWRGKRDQWGMVNSFGGAQGGFILIYAV